jgi:hypothetical protein
MGVGVCSPSRVSDPRRRVLGDGQALGSEDPTAVAAGRGSHLHLLADPVAEQRLGSGERTETACRLGGLDRMDDELLLHDALTVSHRHGLL